MRSCMRGRRSAAARTRPPGRAFGSCSLPRLREELAATKSALARAEQGGSDPQVAKRLAELEEGQKVARGLAVEAALARSRAEAELRDLRDAIAKAPGLAGWLMRRAHQR